MKSLAIITSNNTKEIQWQFDKIIAMIAFDVELKIVFLESTHQQLTQNKIWRSLAMYEVHDVYAINCKSSNIDNALFSIKNITTKTMKKLIQQTDVII